MDLDETVLDNAAYSAWLARPTNTMWSRPAGLDGAAAGQALPGRWSFVAGGQAEGGCLLHHQPQCVPWDGRTPPLEHTRRNLLALGFERWQPRPSC